MPKGLIRQALQVVKSDLFNIDNGAGVTIDSVLFLHAKPVNIQRAYVLYSLEVTQTVAAATVSVGTTIGGVDIVAATALANAVQPGTTTALALLKARIPANTMVSVRHTGIAVTQTGQYYLVIEYSVDE